jgi:hypothetical protein
VHQKCERRSVARRRRSDQFQICRLEKGNSNMSPLHCRNFARKRARRTAPALAEVLDALDPLRQDCSESQYEPNRKSRIQAFVLGRPELLELAADAARGDELAGKLVHAIAGWLSRAGTTELGQAPMCLDCPTTFHDGVEPTAFALALVEGDDTAIVTGVCQDCNERAERGDGLLAVAIRRWREVWPDLLEL